MTEPDPGPRAARPPGEDAAERAAARRRRAARAEQAAAHAQARAAAAGARAEARRAREAREVLHAGRAVSARLGDARSDEAALAARGLPCLHDAADLAALLGEDVRALRWLTYDRRVAAVVHYRQFEVPKRRGGARLLAAPRPRLRAALQVVRARLLAGLAPTEHAHAFVAGRSVLTNAQAHPAPAVLVKVDLRDFFGTIDWARLRGLFASWGYSGQVATLLALLCTEAPRVEVDLDGRRLFVAVGTRALPQGAPTSPALTNLLCRRLDRRLAGWAARHGWRYTRYADDVCLSRAEDPGPAGVGRALGLARRVLRDEGFAVNEDKVVVVRRGRQQRVTGVVVNGARPTLPRRDLRRFRAAVHRVTKDGFRDAGERARLLGWAAWARMIRPDLGQGWLEALRRVPS